MNATLPWTVTLFAKGLKHVATVDALGKSLEMYSEETSGQLTRHVYRIISIDNVNHTACTVFDYSRVSRHARIYTRRTT